jgi:hypothetical protein
MTGKRRTRENRPELAQISDRRRRRGRPTSLRYDRIYGTAKDLRLILNQVWSRLWPLLSTANSEAEVVEAFRNGANPYAERFLPYASIALEAKQDATFPKRPASQQRFLADSLAALGAASARRSRDICTQERMKAKRTHHIIRSEYYVECSCGYEGPAKDRACRKCGAQIPPRMFG